MNFELDATMSSDSLRDLILGILSSNKAVDIKVLDISEKSAFARYMIIASCESGRHVKSLARHLSKEVKQYKNLQIEGMESGHWVVVSMPDILIHIFRPEVREYYKLEDLWSMSPVVPESGSGSIASE